MHNHFVYKITQRNRLLGLLMVIVFAIMMISIAPLAQTKQSSKDKLETKKKKLEEEIAYNKQLLDETRKNKKLSLNQLNLLQSQILNREALLDEINIEIDSLGRVIQDNDEMLQKQHENLKVLKEEYARIIYHAWKTRNANDKLLFIFSAQDFDQAYKRIIYFQQYSEYRKKQAELIVSAQDDISRRMFDLKIQKDDKTNLLVDNESEKEKLDREKAEKDLMLKKLKQQEASIKKTLKTKQAEEAKLQQKIEAIISSEINKSAGITNKQPVSNSDVKNVLTPEEKVMSNNFISNKGKLPWPVVSGVISGYYGEHDHPVLPGIKVKNNGIDISTGKGAFARVVFNGIVASIVTIANNNKAVIVRHGDYFTVYSNLQTVNVNKGDNLTTKQNIGTIYTDDEEGKTILHFEVWEGKLLHNPTEWLSAR
jgi:murein hydrolase activator